MSAHPAPARTQHDAAKNLPANLVKLLPWFHSIALAAVFLQPSTPATILGRYSRTAFVILLILLLSLPVTVGASRWITRRMQLRRLTVPPKLRPFVWAVTGALAFVFGGTTASATDSYIVLSLYLLFGLFTAFVWTLVQGFDRRGSVTWLGASEKLAAVVVAASCLILLGLATRYPGQLWTDEGYNTSLALSIARNGEVAVPIFRLTPELYGPIYSLVYAVIGFAYQLFGISLSVGRAVIFCIGLISLFCIYRACVEFYSAAAARVAVVLAAFPLLVINYLRADVEVALWLSLAIWAFAKASQTKQQRWHLVVGLVVGFSLDGHPNAYRFIGAFAAAYLLDYLVKAWKRRMLRVQHPVFLLSVGLALGLFGYIALYSVLAPDAFFSRLNSTGVGLNFGAVGTELATQFSDLLRNAPLLFTAAVFGVALVVRRRTALGRLSITVLVISTLWLSIGYGYYRTYYLAHSIPLYIVLAASAFDYLHRRFEPSRASFYLNLLLIFAVVTSFGWLYAKVGANRSQDYSHAVDIARQIRAYLSPEETFIGADPLYFGMHDYPHFVEFNSGVYMASRDGIPEQQVWERLDPAAIAIIQDYPIAPPASLLTYMSTNGFTLLRCWESDRIGRVDLYVKVPAPDVTPGSTCDHVTGSLF